LALARLRGAGNFFPRHWMCKGCAGPPQTIQTLAAFSFARSFAPENPASHVENAAWARPRKYF